MDWKTWALFAVMEATLSLTPGPAVLFVLGQGLRRGGAGSIWANLGVLSGNLVYFAISATGVGALLLRAHSVFFLIKWVGATYLFWLGLSAWFGKAKALAVKDYEDRRRGPRVFIHAVVMQLANPKALVFFAALLPLFIDARRPLVPQFVILALTSVVIEFCVLAAYGFLAGRAAQFAERPDYARLMDRIAGALLIVAGLMVAAIRRA
ncbi:MAG TPA: LysE family translocator [Caulobacteraceae bacterium]|nr:LysE family translocator [Caulobacteraceae bacterium]